MTADEWQRISDIWHAVLARPEHERPSAIDEMCGADEALRGQVQSLLAHLARADAAGFGTNRPRPAPPSIAPGTTFGPYRIQNLIGAGGMGVVYRARDQRLARDIAIKLLPGDLAGDPDRLRRFEQEARSAAALNHPNILAVYDIGRHEGAPYIVSELLEGATLRERLNELRTSGLPIRKCVDYATQIARGLAAAHEKGVVHRDLKPENVFITADGHAKILDFGLAKLTETSPKENATTVPTRESDSLPGTVLGTAGYMAPEQARGLPADARADIFAFGATTYEMLSGRRAFRGDTTIDTLTAILTEEPPPLTSADATVPPALALIVHRCLEKAPAARFQTASDLAFALEALSGSSPALPAAGLADTTFGRRRAAQWVAGLGVALTSGALFERFIDRRDPPPPGPAPGPAPGPGPGKELAITKPVTRMAILRPQGTQFTNTGRQGIAMASDGTIVFIANRQLWVKQLDAEEATPIEGAESTALTMPFLSPDEKRVGYFQGGSLKKIPLAGGEPQLLCEGSSNWGASWGTDDRIVYALQDGVYRVEATGGMPVKIVTFKNGESVYGPQILPGGTHLLMSLRPASASSWDEAQIVVQSLSTGERTPIKRGHDARYLAATGHLVYGVGGTVYAVAFDAKSLQVQGDSVLMQHGVRTGLVGGVFFALSPIGDFAYVPQVETLQTNTIAIRHPNGKIDRLSLALRRALPRLSPDGSRFVALDRDDGLSVYTVADVSQVQKLSDAKGRMGGAIWSRDGKTITAAIDGKYWNLAADGNGEPEELRTSGAAPIGWSPDGTTFYSGGRDHIYAWSREKGSLEVVLPPETKRKGPPSLSSNGAWLAAWRPEDRNTTCYIQSIESVSGTIETLTIAACHHPMWHPDNRHLYYVAQGTSTLMKVEVFTNPLRLGTRTAVMSGVAQEVDDGGRNFDVDRDGKLIIELLEDHGSPEERQIRVVLNWAEELKQKVTPRS